MLPSRWIRTLLLLFTLLPLPSLPTLQVLLIYLLLIHTQHPRRSEYVLLTSCPPLPHARQSSQRIPREGEPTASIARSIGETGTGTVGLLVDDDDLPFARRQSSFRVCCKHLLVTYSQADGCDPDSIVRVLRGDQLVFRLGRE